MATSPIRNPRDPQTGRTTTEDEAPIGGMQEPMGTMERPGSSVDDRRDNLNIRNTSTAAPRSDRGYGSTFAIAAVVLLLAFLVALYFGMSGPDTTTTTTVPADEQAPVTETVPNTTGEAPATESTVPVTPTVPETTGEAPAPAPAPAPVPDTGTGTTNQ